MKHIPGTIQNSRMRNGVGRPPAVNLLRREKAAALAIARACHTDLRKSDLPMIYAPPSNDTQPGRQYFTEHGWCHPLILSTAALRKSKRRKGKG